MNVKILAVCAAAAMLLPACASSNKQGVGSDCGKALDAYHAALVASDPGDGTGPNLTDAEESLQQNAVVAACDLAGFQAFLKGTGYDYTSGPDAIAIGDPTLVFKAFCSGAPKPNHCS